MCYHNSISVKGKELALRYDREEASFDEMRFLVTAFSNPEYPIVTKDKKLQRMKWGLIPFWLKARKGESAEDAVKHAESLRKGTYNARSETIFEKPSYRESIKRRRCLIPATGYFEYHHNPDKTTTPYFIKLKSEKIFSMGGIFDHWTNPVTGEEMTTYSQITTEPNPLMREIHNGGKNPFRMPLIIPKQDEEKWLDPDLSKPDIEKLMNAYPQSDMEAHPISKDFIHKNPHDPSILKISNLN